MEVLRQMASALERGEDELVVSWVTEALAGGLSAEVILDQGLIAGMRVVGEQFRLHEIFLPDVLLAAKAMTAGMGVLKPLLEAGDTPRLGRIVLGSVKGDLHDIGKNLVGIMLKGAGFDVVDLGSNVSPEAFVDTAESTGARAIGMSALITTTMPVMKDVVELVRVRGLTGRVLTVVGGAPVTESYAKSIGADGYAYDAANAVVQFRRLLGVN